MKEITYGPVREEDAESIAALYWRGMLNDERMDFIQDVTTKYPAFLARLGSRVVGFAYTNRFAPDILELDNIFVHEDFRGQNIGTKLLSLIESEAANEFRQIVVVNSALYENEVADKRPAAGFYEKFGYQRIIDTGPTQVFTKQLGE